MEKKDLVANVEKIVYKLKNDFVELSKYLHDNPEVGFNEYKSSLAICNFLEKNGFNIEMGRGKLATAFKAVSGYEGKKIKIAFIAEYDALPKIGHACGHNLIATMAAGASVVVNKILNEMQIDGEIIVLGTPAEEGGGGKVLMIEEGYFENIDCAIMIHPASRTMVEDYSLAISRLKFIYHGKEAHAAAFPWEGANALEAVIQTFNLINAWRCQMKDGTRLHGIITKGGSAINVIPELAEAKFSIRSQDKEYLKELVDLVKRCASNAASSMKVDLEVEPIGKNYDPVVNSPILEKLMLENFKLVGEEVLPRLKDQGIGSTDMGNVTQKMPAIHAHIRIEENINTHTVLFEKACAGESGRKALLKGIEVMSITALEIFKSPIIVEKMWEEFKQRIKN